MKLFDKIKEIWEFVKSIKNPFGSDTKAGIFIRKMKNRMGIGSPERNATDTYERGMPIVPECISANENEIPVKQYNIAILRNLLKFERAEGHIQVTNKRVIFRAAGRSVVGRTTLQHEFAVNEIAGIGANNNYKFSFLYLIFAILIILLASLIIYRPTDIASPMDSLDNRISSVMFPKHVQKAYSNEITAISRTGQAQKNVTEAGEKIKLEYEKEEAAGLNVRNGIQRTRRVQYDTNWRGEPLYTTETYRDRTPAGLMEAQNALDAAIDQRERAEAEEQRLIAELKTAGENEAKAIKRRENTVMTWRVLMTLFGFVLGVICLIPFFVLYKRFGLKLFILNFSIFGFALALAASGFRIFILFLIISLIIAIVCIFIFCFRPNLVISIKNKMGKGEPIDICRGKRTGFAEVFPTEETESAIREIGAMIGDIQKLGDLGLEKWIKK